MARPVAGSAVALVLSAMVFQNFVCASLAVRCSGVNLLQSNGEGAGQSVPHLHVHILPRYPGDKVRLNWVYTPGDKAEIEAICNRLKGAL